MIFMDLRAKFANTENRDAFAKRFNLTSIVDDISLDISWHYINFLKDDKTVTVSLLGNVEDHDFIVKGTSDKFASKATVKKDLGVGFYLVTSNDGIGLAELVDSIESASAPLAFMTGSDITGVNPVPTSAFVDPTSPSGQWPRIRVTSRYRPLATSFSLHDVTYQNTPELYIIDSGINFDHVEFKVDGIQKENFYAIPAANGDFSDAVGHGTGVASMAVGTNVGIAQNCKLINVKIAAKQSDGSIYHGNIYDIAAALDTILERIANNPNLSRIINISWGITPRSSYLDSKVQSLIDAGALVVCAVGNQGIDVADISPAGLTTTLSVGSIDQYDIPSGFNNIAPSDANITTATGEELDIFAPGENVVTADNASNYTYQIVSGTSFAAPIVSGIATEIASLFKTTVTGEDLKQTIIDTATKNALLFEDDKFSENQNNIAYLYTADPNANYKTNNMTTYLGIHDENQPIIFDLHSGLDISTIGQLHSDMKFSIEFLDAQTEQDYKQFFSVDADTGIVTITEPTVSLPDADKLKMVEFKGVASNDVIKMETGTMFFFQCNPLYKDTREADITLALTNTNSVSFYATWNSKLK